MHARIFSIAVFCDDKSQNTAIEKIPAVIRGQGEGHKVWGNAPKKSNSATCAHFHKSARCTSKHNIFLIFGNFWGVKSMTFHEF